MNTRKFTTMDPHQIQKAIFEEDFHAQRVIVLNQNNIDYQKKIFKEVKLLKYSLFILVIQTSLILSYLIYGLLNKVMK